MGMPFERLVELVAALSDDDASLPMGQLAERWGEPVRRVADAVDAVRVLNGERTYIPVFTCPCCGATSPNPADVINGYCALCHWWTGDPVVGPMHMAAPCDARK